ncbi:transposase [Komagataeibacter xylinus E25]|nr:transposase [Komagataeibacter xylinus E25]
MELLSMIRRWHCRDHLPIHEIERRTGLSRNTIRKYLRTQSIEPQFQVPERPGRLDPFADRLRGWLVLEAARPRKNRRTARRLHEELVALGYDGSYGRVAAFIRQWKHEQHQARQTTGRGVFVPLSFQPGEAFQFDWGEDWAVKESKSIPFQKSRSRLGRMPRSHWKRQVSPIHDLRAACLECPKRGLSGLA